VLTAPSPYLTISVPYLWHRK